MMTRHSITHLIAGFVLLCLATSCQDFLDREPVAQIPPGTQFTSGPSANSAVNGMYRTMMNSFSFGQSFLVIPEFSANHLAHVNSFPEFENFATHGVVATGESPSQPLPPLNIWLANMWQAAYATINAANNIIVNVAEMPEASIEEEERQQYIGEARFIRALHYFFLARAFGSVPLELQPTGENIDELAPQVTQQELYDQVIEDLTAAVELLPEQAGTGLAEKGRASRWAAKALLAKVYLYYGTLFSNDFTQSAALAEDVITNGPFSLVGNFISIWQTENTNEAIFELQFDEQATNPMVNVIGDNTGNLFHGRGEIPYNLYDSLDNRRSATLRRGTRENFMNRWYIAKFPNMVPPTQNLPLIRLAEIYLIHAEAQARVDNTVSPASYASLAEVQNRAGVTQEMGSFTSLSAYITAIQLEKERELMFEGETWFDFCRTGLALTRYQTLTSEDYYIYPIPSAQFQVDPGLTQNQGY